MPLSAELMISIATYHKKGLSLSCPEQKYCTKFEVGKKHKFKHLYTCAESDSPWTQSSIATASTLKDLYRIQTPKRVHPESGIGEVESHLPNNGWTQFYANLMNDDNVIIQPPINLRSDSRGKQIYSQCNQPRFQTPIGGTKALKGKCAGGGQGEVTGDFQVLAAVAPQLQTYVFQRDNNEFEGWLKQMSVHEGAPYVWTTSDGQHMYFPPCAADFESNSSQGANCDVQDSVYLNKLRHQEVEFLKLGLRGYTLFAASGDGGSGANRAKYNTAATLQEQCGFRVQWPAASAYWTVVGGTNPPDYTYDATKTQTLSVVTPTTRGTKFGGITSGGGFSTVSSRNKYSSWQNDAVEKYMNTEYSKIDKYYKNNTVDSEGISKYNMLGQYNGRGYPD